MNQGPETARERAVLLLRETLLPGWNPPVSQRLIWAIRGALVLGVIVLIASAVDKPLWDWLELLVVPVVLAVGGYLFNSSQNEATRAAAERRAQDDALQAYLDKMSDMLISDKGQPSLYDKLPPNNLSQVARARTLTVLSRLDGHRKARVVQFLYESGLINKDHPVVDLNGADLRKADLREAKLVRANLRGANLNQADLSGWYLIVGEVLITSKQTTTDLSEADLSYADLSETDLSVSYLRGANLYAAIIDQTTLMATDLTDAVGITGEELTEGAADLHGATMPNGQKYEDWLESRDGGEDGENGGSS